MKITNKWFPFGYDKMSNKKMVFCFHCAGGNAAFYRDWTKNEKIDFIPIELPGRGRRITETYSNSIDKLVDELVKSIFIASVNREYYFYGHSMGALIAFVAAHKIKSKYNTSPKKLIVAGRTAPQYLDKTKFKSHMDDYKLIEELRRLKGTPKEVLENSEIMKFMLPIVRNDYILLESYSYNGEVLDIPIIAHSGDNDEDATIDDIIKWSEVTNDICEAEEFNGSHFFVQELSHEYHNAVINSVM